MPVIASSFRMMSATDRVQEPPVPSSDWHEVPTPATQVACPSSPIELGARFRCASMTRSSWLIGRRSPDPAAEVERLDEVPESEVASVMDDAWVVWAALALLPAAVTSPMVVETVSEAAFVTVSTGLGAVPETVLETVSTGFGTVLETVFVTVSTGLGAVFETVFVTVVTTGATVVVTGVGSIGPSSAKACDGVHPRDTTTMVAHMLHTPCALVESSSMTRPSRRRPCPHGSHTPAHASLTRKS
jgi:hypothetical protein